MLSRLTIILFSLVFFLSAMDASAASTPYENFYQFKASVSTSIADLLSEQVEDPTDDLHFVFYSPVVPVDNALRMHRFSQSKSRYTFYTKQQHVRIYLLLRILRI